VSQQTRAARASYAAATAQVGPSAKGRCRSKSALCRRSIPDRQAESAFDAVVVVVVVVVVAAAGLVRA
jgi:hypothetical protein